MQVEENKKIHDNWKMDIIFDSSIDKIQENEQFLDISSDDDTKI